MKILILGGTGRISGEVAACLCSKNCEVWVLNRGTRRAIKGSNLLNINIYDSANVKKLLCDHKFDIVIDFLSYTVNDLAYKMNFFTYPLKKYVFISSATVYNTNNNIVVNEESEVGNVYSLYARNKLKCEEFLLKKWQKDKIPIMIVRPSQTYNDENVPVGIHGNKGSWQVVKRIIEGKKIIIHGDGNTCWTMTRSRDFAIWLSDIIFLDELVGHIVQITSDSSMSWNEIYNIIADELGKELIVAHISSYLLADWGEKFKLKDNLLGDKARNIVFDNGKRKKYSNYSTENDMEIGIRAAVRNVVENSEFQRADEEFDMWCNKICNIYDDMSTRGKILN